VPYRRPSKPPHPRLGERPDLPLDGDYGKPPEPQPCEISRPGESLATSRATPTLRPPPATSHAAPEPAPAPRPEPAPREDQPAAPPLPPAPPQPATSPQPTRWQRARTWMRENKVWGQVVATLIAAAILALFGLAMGWFSAPPASKPIVPPATSAPVRSETPKPQAKPPEPDESARDSWEPRVWKRIWPK
jgi:hypothetical protein